jgi:hypothetical protein
MPYLEIIKSDGVVRYNRHYFLKNALFLLKERSRKHNNFNGICSRIIYYYIVLCCFKTIFVFQRRREHSYSHCDVICWTAVLCIVVRVGGYCGERKLCCPKQTDSLLLCRTMEHQYLQLSFSRVQPTTRFSYPSRYKHEKVSPAWTAFSFKLLTFSCSCSSC